MFGIGTGEIVLILVIAMLVFGPERMVEMSRQAGQMLAKFRAETDDITKEFRDTLSLDSAEEEAETSADVSADAADAGTPSEAALLEAPPQSDFPPKPNLTVGQDVEQAEDQRLIVQTGLAVAQFDGEIEVLDPIAGVDEWANNPDLEPVLIHVAETVPEDIDVEPTVIGGPMLVMDDPEPIESDDAQVDADASSPIIEAQAVTVAPIEESAQNPVADTSVPADPSGDSDAPTTQTAGV